MGYPPANTFPPFAVWHSAQYPPPASASPFTINSGAKVWGADARMGAIAGRHASAKKPTTPAAPRATKQITSFLNEDILETASWTHGFVRGPIQAAYYNAPNGSANEACQKYANL